MEKLTGCAVVGQSGGPTAAINATLAGVITAAVRSISDKTGITKIYGMRNGMEGLCDKRLINLCDIFASNSELDLKKLDMLASTPAAALGSCRKKLPKPDADTDYYENVISVFREYDIRYFFYIGGNDSMDTVAKLSAYTAKCGYEMKIVGLPKTIDNDLCGTDHTPGFGSAAKYIATTISEIIRDCAVYTVPAVTIVEIMGRDAGWLTASAALPRIITGYAPDYVYLPEKPFSIKSFMTDVKSALAVKPNVVIAVSEGLRFDDGSYVGEAAQSGAADVFGHKYLAGTGKALELAVKREIGCKVRSVELNISQRCAAHCASLTDITESKNVGMAGVEAALYGSTGCMMSIMRSTATDTYSVSYETGDISKIANRVKRVPDEFINARTNNVTDECLEYLKPLISGEAPLAFRDGLPEFFVL